MPETHFPSNRHRQGGKQKFNWAQKVISLFFVFYKTKTGEVGSFSFTPLLLWWISSGECCCSNLRCCHPLLFALSFNTRLLPQSQRKQKRSTASTSQLGIQQHNLLRKVWGQANFFCWERGKLHCRRVVLFCSLLQWRHHPTVMDVWGWEHFKWPQPITLAEVTWGWKLIKRSYKYI